MSIKAIVELSAAYQRKVSGMQRIEYISRLLVQISEVNTDADADTLSLIIVSGAQQEGEG